MLPHPRYPNSSGEVLLHFNTGFPCKVLAPKLTERLKQCGEPTTVSPCGYRQFELTWVHPSGMGSFSQYIKTPYTDGRYIVGASLIREDN